MISQDTAGYGRIRQDTTGYGRIRVLQEYSRIRETPVGSFQYLWSCQDEKSVGCATHPRLTIVLKTTNWPVTLLKMDWRPFR